MKYLVLILFAISFNLFAQHYDNYIVTSVTQSDSDSLWQMIYEELGVDAKSYEVEFDEQYLNIWYSEEDGTQYRTNNLPKELLNAIRKRKLIKI